MRSETPKNKPVLIELDTPAPSVQDAPELPDDPLPQATGQTMQQVLTLGARRSSTLSRWFWGLLLSVVTAIVSVSAWNFLQSLLAQYPLVGLGFSALLAGLAIVSVVIVVRELMAFRRLRKVDSLHRAADSALADENLEAARKVARDLMALYAARPETAWGRERLAEGLNDTFDAEAVFALAEQELMAPLDAAARKEVEQAARQVATVTALVPLALADVVTALVANIRMIRRIAEVYAGRSGTLGSWRLTRAVMAHLVATGAVAVGDDLLSSIAGGSMLGKISRRFGEGMVNGALTARVGIAAMEVCRPLAFTRQTRPSVRKLVKWALTGVFSSNAE
ncbi:YcjF family protein [Cognatishimia maritima]|uniref:Putative membrane protein n=1 Tax=Cognatishimia maritima TaxID=870908 RepID=A0A1M5KWF3_9RHOB|nr:TIGR01620 family protein [Cognatishimia maritima]SHG57066.1 putative membrane protein [Cognatishimia maritima]